MLKPGSYPTFDASHHTAYERTNKELSRRFAAGPRPMRHSGDWPWVSTLKVPDHIHSVIQICRTRSSHGFRHASPERIVLETGGYASTDGRQLISRVPRVRVTPVIG